LGKRCPQCGWLDEELAIECFRCGHRYNVDLRLQSAIEALPGVRLLPRVFEGEQDLAAFLRGRQPSPPAVFRLRQQAEALRLSRGFGELICLDDIAVEHYEHQLETASRVLRDMRGRVLLADEVGLGKTVEAGIVMKELVERGLAQTILILTPASLTEQWREEMAAKFREKFDVVRADHDWDGLESAQSGRWIVSLDLAKRQPHAGRILGREYDLLIVDEAHKLKNRATQVWRFVNQIRKRYVLMLTATPVQNDLLELYSLITILQPGQLGTVRAFKRQFLKWGDARQPRNERALRRLLSDVMIRNRRSSVGIRFPARRAAIYHLELTPPEMELYRQVTDYIRHSFQQEHGRKYLRLVLLTLQRELCSSPQAVAATLERVIADTHHTDAARARLQGYLELARSIQTPRKLLAVREVLERLGGKLIVFTDYRRTLDRVVDQLNLWGYPAVGFHGGLDIYQKEDAIRAFKGDYQVMVSTESGAEGHNLQFCHQLVNYDLPWNPMRVEQRIGRLHRLGQEHDVTIVNLSSLATIEARILDLLARKIRLFELVVGELDMILGDLDQRKSFEDLLREAWEGSRDEGELEKRFRDIAELLERARRNYADIRRTSDALNDLME
ncbi:MAG: DEAD/DEAH box helicase family protein, partial [Thermoflexales bacterium]|nr:DEAD/DEAH box helicase family protein [Thermoflexales bacterium]